MTCPFGFDDAAYVLGALSPGDRAAYEQHLAGCDSCRAAVAKIAGLPGLLLRLGQPVTEPRPIYSDRVPALLARLRRARRKRRWTAMGAALSTVLIMIVAAGSLAVPRSETPQMLAMHNVSVEKYVTAEVSVTDDGAGSHVKMHCAYPGDGQLTKAWTFRLVAVGTDGTEEQISSWKAASGEEVTVTGTVQFRRSAIQRIELRSRDGTPLLILLLSGG